MCFEFDEVCWLELWDLEVEEVEFFEWVCLELNFKIWFKEGFELNEEGVLWVCEWFWVGCVFVWLVIGYCIELLLVFLIDDNWWVWSVGMWFNWLLNLGVVEGENSSCWELWDEFGLGLFRVEFFCGVEIFCNGVNGIFVEVILDDLVIVGDIVGEKYLCLVKRILWFIIIGFFFGFYVW